MSLTRPDRLAQAALRLFATESPFLFEVEDRSAVEETAQAFERLGCSVKREPHRYWLRITCPSKTDQLEQAKAPSS